MDYHHNENTLTRKPSLMHGYHNPFSHMDRNFVDLNRQSAAAYLPPQSSIQAIIAAAAAAAQVNSGAAASQSTNDDHLKRPRQQLSTLNTNLQTSLMQAANAANIPQLSTSTPQLINSAGNNLVPKMQSINNNIPQLIDSNKKDSSSSSSYIPQTEAISPTPEDQKENSNLQEIKEKIISEINKVDKDLASSQYQIESLKKKQVS